MREIDYGIKNNDTFYLSDMFLSRITDVMSKANKTKIAFYEHSYLWVDSRTEFMHYFLTYGRSLTQEELEALVCRFV